MGKMFRVTRGMKYGALFLAGVITLISPLVIVTEGGGLIISMIWSCFILVGSALSLYGTIRKNWTGEYTGLPAISCSLFFIAVVLIWAALSIPFDSRTIARIVFSLMFFGFTFSTIARWADVKFQKRLADYETRRKNGKPGL